MIEVIVPKGLPQQPMSFAFMRNSHEAFRKFIGTMDTSNDEFVGKWSQFERALKVHMTIEDEGMFALLDGVDGNAKACSNANIPAEHTDDVSLSQAVNDEIKADGKVKAETFNQWKEHHLHHLKHEEDVMMPLTVKTGDTLEARCAIFHEKMIEPAWNQYQEELVWFSGWVVKHLSGGSTTQPANIAIRVFVHALQASTTARQWTILSAEIKNNCPTDIWDEMVRDFHVDCSGYINEF